MSNATELPASGIKQKMHRFWNRWTLNVTEYDPCFKVQYLGNVLTVWAKGEGCVDRPLAILWDNYLSNNQQENVSMKISVCNSGLKAVTKEHGETEYWAYRITFCGTHSSYPRVFCWIYRHETGPLKHELRCHAVLCGKDTKAQQLSTLLSEKLVTALQEFRREKLRRQKYRMSLSNPLPPRRKLLLSTGVTNFRPRSESLPAMTKIEELEEENEPIEPRYRLQSLQSFDEQLSDSDDSCRM
ncbi:protein FAM43A-like [Centruroides vittatus]|uniref:protein FAM43A-like n=1 Tax=Centruroides vittatus TaxID=120091 RepID=UPI00350FF319